MMQVDFNLSGRVSIIRDKRTNKTTIKHHASDDFVVSTIETLWDSTLADEVKQYEWYTGDDYDYMHFWKGASMSIENELNKLFDDVEIVEYSVLTTVGFKTFRVPYSLENEDKIEDLITNFHPMLVFFGTGLYVGKNGNQLEAVVKVKEIK